jgi:hypothetical protein
MEALGGRQGAGASKENTTNAFCFSARIRGFREACLTACRLSFAETLSELTNVTCACMRTSPTSRLMHACRTGLVGLSGQLLSVSAEPARAGDDQERIHSNSGTLGRYLFRRKIMSQHYWVKLINLRWQCWVCQRSVLLKLVIAYNIDSSRLPGFFIDMFPHAGSFKVCSRHSMIACFLRIAASKLLLISCSEICAVDSLPFHTAAAAKYLQSNIVHLGAVVRDC